MSVKALTLTVATLLLSVCQLQANVINSRWVGGAQGDWGNASNWYPPIVPDNTVWDTYLVSIEAYDHKIAVGIGQKYSVDQLACRGDVTLYGPWYPVNLTLVKGLTNYGELDALRLDFTGDVKNTNGAELQLAEFFSVHGNLYNEPNATVEVTDREMDVVDANIVNHGLIRAYSNGGLEEAIEFRNYGRIELFNGGMGGRIFDNNSTGVIEGWGSVRSDRSTVNKGIIYAAYGSLVMPSGGPIVNTGIMGNKPLASLHMWSPADVNNYGTIEVNAGGGVAFDCNMVNEPNAVVKLLNGILAAKTIIQKAGATFQGFGGITGNVVIEPNAVVELTGPTNIVGDVTIGENASLEISDGTVLIIGLTTCNGGTIRIKGGRIITQGGSSGLCQTIIVN